MTAANRIDYSNLVHDIYGCAVDPARFPVVSLKINDFIGMDGATLVLHRTDTQQILFSTMLNYDHLPVEEILNEYRAEWHLRNPQVLFEQARPDADIYYEGCDARFNCEVYDEFARWRDHGMGIKSQMTAYCRPADNITYAFAFSSARDAGPQNTTHLDLFRDLSAHLRQAVSLAWRIGTLENETVGLLARLEATVGPVLIVDRSGQAIFINASMDRVLGSRSDLRTSAAGLAATHPADDVRLQAALAAAMGDNPLATHFRLRPTSADLAPLMLHIAPLTERFAELSDHSGKAIITVANAARPETALKALFTRVLKLTDAEAAIALHLMKGLADDRIAALRNVAVSTVRTHVRSILGKAQLSTKAELAHFLTALAARNVS